MGEHTKLPWHASRKSRYVSDIHHNVIAEIAPLLHAFEANAAFIVDAVNNHDRLTRENEAMRKALKAVIGLQPYINNPSAWDHFDDEMSERLGTIVDGALASLKEPTDAQA